MLKNHFNILLLFLLSIPAIGQKTAFESSPNYWKNKLPFAGYWQQDVAYTIHATIDETTDKITATETLVYTNNSPDTLYHVFFHLYQNAFQPGAYLHHLQLANDEHPRYGKYESKKQGTQINAITADNENVSLFLDNTILKVSLAKPILPGGKATFQINFTTYYDNGSTRRRMKKYDAWRYTHYNGCQWYPKICVYDRKSGWNTDQHLNREFYGDFGTFDVTLDFASNYVLEATGVLQNENEVLPDTLKQKLAIKNFAAKKWDEAPSIITPYKKGERKKWHYFAENVHDFAFTADPSYRIADTIWNGVRCVAIVQEPHASGWQDAASFCADIIRCFSTDFGMYEYPKMVVADAADGMEYPMITLDGGASPGYRSLLIHEVGHNWFYGMLGNNETYRAFLDEGFTQFLTVWGLEHLFGDTIPVPNYKNKYVKHFSEAGLVRDRNAYLGYLRDATLHQDPALNTHSDGFNGALGHGGGYGHVYSKTATMLYNLQYVLGDELFQNAMKYYVEKWKFCHPYPEDFRDAITAYTHADLKWFFDEWLETSKNIDYKIKSVQHINNSDTFIVKIKRNGRMQMPIDLRITAKNDSIQDYYIPNTWFEKNTIAPNDTFTRNAIGYAGTEKTKVTLLPKWYGWDKLLNEYNAVIIAPNGIKNASIDPSNRLADINYFNNLWRKNVLVKFDAKIANYPELRKYVIWMRPDIWYNAYDGIKIGFHAHGSYMNVKHIFSFDSWINTHLLQNTPTLSKETKRKADWFNYRFTYQTPINKLIKNTTVYGMAQWLDGLEMYKVGGVMQLPNNFSIDLQLKAFTRPKNTGKYYLLYPDAWSTFWTKRHNINTSLNLTVRYNYYKTKANGSVILKWRSATLFNQSNYHYLELTQTNATYLGPLDIRTRFYARLGVGNRMPLESALYLAGGNPEEMMESKYYRANMFLPASQQYFDNAIGNYHFGGGLNVRGFNGLSVMPSTVENAYGKSGVAANIEIDFNRIIKVKNQKLKSIFDLNTYWFTDIATIANSYSGKQKAEKLYADAGFGIALTIKRFAFLQNIKPLTLRFDMPFITSQPTDASGKKVQFRWLIGINRCF